MSGANQAVFLSYASQDAAAAKRLCDALRAVGVEVWFDQNELVGGDAWDAKIRRQIQQCALFVPVISANTQARIEGYFRLEWDLAAERARTIASGVAFILPIVVDDTREAEALVPDRFRMVQWTRLPGGEVPASARQRFLELWSRRMGAASPGAETPPAAAPLPLAAPIPPRRGKRGWGALAAAAIVVLGGAGYFGWRVYVAERAAMVRGVLGQPEPVKKQSRALVARFENRTGEPSLDLVGELIADRVRRELPELEWVKEARLLPATEKIGDDLTPDDMARLARKTGADALVLGAYHRQGEKLILRGRVLDLSRGTTWADLAPIEGAVADPSAALEEMAARLVGGSRSLGRDRQGAWDAAAMLNLAVPQRWDSLRLRLAAGTPGLSSAQSIAMLRRSYELDPKGGAGSLVAIAVGLARGTEYARADEMLQELDALPPERLVRIDRERIAWVRAVTTGNLRNMMVAAQGMRRLNPNDRFALEQWCYGLVVSLQPKALLAEFADVTPGSPRENNPRFWSYRAVAYFMLQDYTAQLAAARRWRELQPESQNALQFSLLAQLGLGDNRSALQLLDAASGMRETGREGYPGYHFVVALAQLRRLGRGETPEFATVVTKAEAWFASRPPSAATSEMHRYDLARVRYLAARYADARRDGEALVRDFPDNRAYRGFVGSCAARLGDAEAARAMLAWLRALNPQYRFGHQVYLQARICALLGQRDDALRFLREAIVQYAAPVADFHATTDFFLDADFEPLATDSEFKAIVGPKG